MVHIFFTLCFVFLTLTAPASAQFSDERPLAPSLDETPALKSFMQGVGKDAHLEYIGERYGIRMWIATKNGIVQILYTSLDGDGLIANGLLFGPRGNAVTEREISDYFAARPSVVEKMRSDLDKAVEARPMSKSERLLRDIRSKAETITYGSSTAPELISFVDPICPFCRDMWDEVATSYVGTGRLRWTLVPLGALGAESIAVMAEIFTDQDPSAAWIKHHQEPMETPRFPDPSGVELVEKNNNLAISYNIESTPLSLYRNANGEVKVIIGMPKDMEALLDDMTAEPAAETAAETE